MREQAPGRAVAVNLLLPFTRRRHVAVCVEARVDVVVLAFGENRGLVAHLRQAGAFVFVMVGTVAQARAAIAWGADGLIAQGREAGGHLVGTTAALDFLPHALAAAAGRPVFLAGGIATAADSRAALDAGADGVIAGTRFLLTHESDASRGYQQRVLQADNTIETNLFGLSWPLRHRVVPNAATRRWCGAHGKARRCPPHSTRRAARCRRWAISTRAHCYACNRRAVRCSPRWHRWPACRIRCWTAPRCTPAKPPRASANSPPRARPSPTSPRAEA